MTEATAVTKYVRVTPIKLSFLAQEIRGKTVNQAIDYLTLSPKRRIAGIVSRTIKSAVANAQQRGTMDVDNLIVSKLLIGKGPTLKRFIPKAKGSAGRILKYSSHITVTVSEADTKKKTKKAVGK